MLEAVKIRDPERVFSLYPHEVSGGMGQRAMIAMMLVTDPDLLIADEPTSALDVTVQMEVLRILDELVSERGMGLIFISHDLKLVSSFCDRVLVMYAGRVVEELEAQRPRRGQASLHAGPDALPAEPRATTSPAADAQPRSGLGAVMLDRCSISRTSASSTASGRLQVDAVKDVSFARRARRRPSASSANRAPASRRCCAPSAASRRSRAAASASTARAVPSPRGKAFYRTVQMVFQDPYGSLHPRHTVDRTLAEPLAIHGERDAEARILQALREVGPRAVLPLPLSAPALRRPAPAHRHRPRADPAPEGPASRRADLGARRFRPGRNPEPARRPARASSA